MISSFEFLVWAVLVALAVKFLRTLADKWGILEYLQLHATEIQDKLPIKLPTDFMYKLFSCEFCQSWWLGICLSILLAIFVDWHLIFVPIFSSNIR